MEESRAPTSLQFPIPRPPLPGNDGGPQDGPPLWLLLGLSSALFVTAVVVHETFRWTHWKDGFANGLFHAPLYGIFGIPCCLVIGILLDYLSRWKNLRRFRTPLVTLPGWGFLLLAVCGMMIRPPSAENRLLESTGVAFPADAANVSTFFSGGGLTDGEELYSFECSAGETDRLIRELRLKRMDENLPATAPRNHLFQPGDGPDFSTWGRGECFSNNLETDLYSLELFTDAARRRIYIVKTNF